MDIATAATLGATAITLAWFIRDMKRENTKVLKRIEEGQREGFKALSNDSKTLSNILVRIEEGQRKGFENSEKTQESIAKILERIESNTRKRGRRIKS